MRLVLASFYHRLDEYPNPYSLAAMRLASYLLSKNNPTTILPLDLYADPKECVDFILRKKPDLVGLPAYMWTIEKSREIATLLSSKGIPIVVGGPETSTLNTKDWPDRVLYVVGEGEIPLHRIAESSMFDDIIDSPQKTHPSIYSRKKEGWEIFYPTNLPTGIPLFSREFFEKSGLDFSKYSFSWYDTAISCPYRCGYCGHKTRPNVALRDDNLIEEEIRNIGRLGLDWVFIIDPILGGKKGRDKKILEMFRKYAPLTAIKAYYRAEFLDNEAINLLRQSNIREISIGIQTTNPNVPQWIRSNNIEKILSFLPLFSQYGIPLKVELIVGLPGDNSKGLRETFRFVIDEIRPTKIAAYHLTVIRGTPLHQILNGDEKGMPLWVHADENGKATESNSYSYEELQEMLAMAERWANLYNEARRNGYFPSFDEIQTMQN
ncbi:MAG: radical SAM protein [Candidatus Aenigmarchaeota archaeon]|nr:radical SAM protein [Candidatus Aenigmarchaeota archaeon]